MPDKMKKVRLKWFGHVREGVLNPLVRRCERLGVGVYGGVEVGQKRIESR